MKKLVVILVFLAFGCSVSAEDTNVSSDYFNDLYFYDYRVEPSQAIFEAEQNNYIEENFGSSASYEYLNSPDDNSWGGNDFDRNY